MRPESANILNDAAEQIGAVAAELDRSEELCGHCGTNRKNNWAESQMAQELDVMVRKLHKFAGELKP